MTSQQDGHQLTLARMPEITVAPSPGAAGDGALPRVFRIGEKFGMLLRVASKPHDTAAIGSRIGMVVNRPIFIRCWQA